jgi:hypothetical protein
MRNLFLFTAVVALIVSCGKQDNANPVQDLLAIQKSGLGGTNYYWYDNSADCEVAIEGEDYGCDTGAGSCVMPGAIIEGSHYDIMYDVNDTILIGTLSQIRDVFSLHEDVIDDYVSKAAVEGVINGTFTVDSRTCPSAQYIYWIFRDSMNRVVLAFPFKEG